jgi:hypothetical protein
VLTRVLYLLVIGGALGACVRDKPAASPPAASSTAVASLPPAPTTEVARGGDSVRADVRSACSGLADAAKRNGAGEILFRDTVSAAFPGTILCQIRTQGFGIGGIAAHAMTDLMSASGWDVGQLEGDDYGGVWAMTKGEVQCDIEFMGHHPPVPNQPNKFDRLRAFCWG